MKFAPKAFFNRKERKERKDSVNPQLAAARVACGNLAVRA